MSQIQDTKTYRKIEHVPYAQRKCMSHKFSLKIINSNKVSTLREDVVTLPVVINTLKYQGAASKHLNKHQDANILAL